MGVGAMILLLVTRGSVSHWWAERGRDRRWWVKLIINGIGLVLTFFILISVVVLKCDEGGWITLVVTGALVGIVLLIKRHYRQTHTMLRRLDDLVHVIESTDEAIVPEDIKNRRSEVEFNPKGKTAVIMVNGFTSVGIDTVEEIAPLSKEVLKKYPGAVFFGGPLVFGKESVLIRLLHNYTVFTIQRRFYQTGIPVMVLPIRVY